MSEETTQFASWLLRVMNRNDLTVEQVADRSGVSRKDVRNWMRGNSIPKTVYFVFLLKALSQLIECDEALLYQQSSEAILKDS